MSYKFDEFRSLVTNVVTEMGQVRKGMFNVNFVTACMMACAHESLGGKYRRQLGGGPARGVLQIEKATHDDVWEHSDTIHEVAKALGIEKDWSRVEYDDRYSIFIMRHKFAMDSKRIPCDLFGIADYTKRVWNGDGKATPTKYIDDYCAWERGEL